MNKICYGCGVKLQSTNNKKNGYVPEDKLKDAKYCMRCFRMMNYGEIKEASTPKDVKEIVNKINKDYRFVIFLVDFINLNKEVVKIFKSIKQKKVLILNKCELIPKHIKREKLPLYIKEYYGIKDDVCIKGGSSSHGAKSVLNYLYDQNIKEAYILGISNSGKSTLINDLIDICKTNINKITVNKKANTTLDFIRVKLNDELTLIDSPGFIIDSSLEHDFSGKNIKALSYNLKECETIGLIDNKYFLKVENKTPIIFYTNTLAVSPIKKYFKAAPNLVNTIDISEDNMDIVIYGIGFITVKKATKITTNIDLSHIEVRKSMFGGNHE